MSRTLPEPVKKTFPALMTERQLAAEIGFSISTVQKWRFDRVAGTPPHVKIGHSVRYRGADVQAWLADLTGLVRR